MPLEKGVFVVCICSNWIGVGVLEFKNELVEKTRLSLLMVEHVTDVTCSCYAQVALRVKLSTCLELPDLAS